MGMSSDRSSSLTSGGGFIEYASLLKILLFLLESESGEEEDED